MKHTSVSGSVYRIYQPCRYLPINPDRFSFIYRPRAEGAGALGAPGPLYPIPVLPPSAGAASFPSLPLISHLSETPPSPTQARSAQPEPPLPGPPRQRPGRFSASSLVPGLAFFCRPDTPACSGCYLAPFCRPSLASVLHTGAPRAAFSSHRPGFRADSRWSAALSCPADNLQVLRGPQRGPRGPQRGPRGTRRAQ